MRQADFENGHADPFTRRLPLAYITTVSFGKLLRRFAFPFLLLLALLLRLQSWYPFEAVDEKAILNMVWGLHLDPLPAGMLPPLTGYPPLFIYLNFFLALVFREILVFLGAFASAGEFLASPSGQMFTLKAGQILVAILGTWHIAVVWKIGREFFDRRIALLAALLIAFHPHLVLNGHIFKSDVPLALCFSLLLLFSLRFLRTLETKDFLTASFMAGLTTACKFNGAVEVLLIPYLLWAVRQKLASARWRRLLLLSPLFGLLGFLAGAPNYAVHPIRNFQLGFRFALFHFQEYTFYDPVSSTYGRYVVDLWRTLGPLFALLFAVGLVFTFLRRNREEMAVAFSLLIYFIFQGRSVYYGTRIILPIYGAVALIAAKAAFQDILPLLKKPLLKRAFSTAVFAGALLLTIWQIRDSVSLFNLWKSTTTWEEALIFRKEHIPSAYRFGRENFTPGFAGDVGINDILSIPHRLFFEPDALLFLSTGLLTEHILNRSHNEEVRAKLQARFQKYRAFHRISKPRFSPWDGDITFWYRPHPKILASSPGGEKLSLPRVFQPHLGTTLFFPLQPYEKDPGFFPLEGDYFGRWILSPRPLRSISLVLFCPEGEIEATVKVNRSESLLRTSRGIAEKFFFSPTPLPLQKAPLYRIEVKLPGQHPQAFLLIQENPSQPPSEAFVLSSPLEGDLPPISGPAAPPQWAMEFYRRTGIDLSLLSLTQETTLWENTEHSLAPFQSEWTVLSRGVYRWEMETEPLLPDLPLSPPPLEIVSFRGDHLETRTLTWEKSADNLYTAILENPEKKIFIRIKAGDLRNGNLLLRSLRLRPDYRLSLRSGMLYLIP